MSSRTSLLGSSKLQAKSNKKGWVVLKKEKRVDL